MHEQVHCHGEAANHQLPRATAFLNHPNSFCRGMYKLNAKFYVDVLLYSLSHFECDGHIQMLTQWHLLPPLTSTVKSSLFTHVHSSPHSLAARLHGCSCFIINGWTFSGQTSDIILKKYNIHIFILCLYIYLYYVYETYKYFPGL